MKDTNYTNNNNYKDKSNYSWRQTDTSNLKHLVLSGSVNLILSPHMTEIFHRGRGGGVNIDY